LSSEKYNKYILNKETMRKILSLSVILVVLLRLNAQAQTTFEFLNAAGGPAAITSGPNSTAPVVITFYNSAGTAPASPLTTATFSYSNQQFPTTQGNRGVAGAPIMPGSSFATGNTPAPSTGANQDWSYGGPFYENMNGISAPSNSNFTACATCPAGTGIDITVNKAVNLYNTSDALLNDDGTNAFPLNSRVYYSDLTITFNRPVNNPILHVVGLGGQFATGHNIPAQFPGQTAYNPRSVQYEIGFATEFDLITSGITLKKLSGNATLNVTPTSITNSSTNLGAATAGAVSASSGLSRQAATGSIQVEGIGITEIKLKVYLRGDGGVIMGRTGTGTSSTAFQTAPYTYTSPNITAAKSNGVSPTDYFSTFGNGIKWSQNEGFSFVAPTTWGGTPIAAGPTSLGSFSGDKYLMGLSFQDCQNILEPSADQSICVGATGSNITVKTDRNSSSSIKFVKFTSDQMAGTTPTNTEATAIYAGTGIGSAVTPTGSASPYTATYTWNSADFSTPGTYYVYAILNTAIAGDCYPVQEIKIVVNPKPTVTGGVVCKDQTLQLTGSGTPATTNPYVSGSTGIATVSSTGLVTALANGLAIITYTDINGCTDTAQVTVQTCIAPCVTPTATVAATQVTCNGNTANADGTITASGFASGARYQYSVGATFTTGIPATITAVPAGGVLVNNLANPATSQMYTIRIFDPTNDNCFVDRQVTLNNKNCFSVANCPKGCATAVVEKIN
jgi:hypothetical protein